MTMANIFGNNIKFLRKQHKITQSELAKHINKTPNTVSNWEQGIRQPIVADVITLCKFFNVDYKDLLEKDLSLYPDLVSEQKKEKLFSLFSRLSAEQQDAIINMIESMIK